MAAACEPIQKDKCSLVGLGLCSSGGGQSVCIQSQRNAKKQFIEYSRAGLQPFSSSTRSPDGEHSRAEQVGTQ